MELILVSIVGTLALLLIELVNLLGSGPNGA